MKIRFVRDEAAGRDAFGGHGPIAKTLASLIDETPEVRTIGLLGPWGSGKSTVVSLASQRLRESTITYTFDAWAHQGDPPRKAIIEGLVEFLDQAGICSKKKWEKQLDELTRRVETHEIESTPTLTPWGVGIAMSLLLLPLGIRLSAAENPSAIIGWIMTSLPFALALGNWWWWRPIRNPLSVGAFNKNNLSENRTPHVGKSIVSIFVNKATDKTTNRIAKTPEPSTIEFRDFFKELTSSIGEKAEKLVIIIDNLDRVSEQDASNVWSTVRSLFSWPDMEDTASLLKVIIPLDYISLYRFLDQKDDISPQDKLRTQSLIDKTFDVVLRVVPPVATDWHRYLSEKMKFSLLDYYDNSKAHLARVMFQSSMEELGKTNSITPRSVNSYVNAIAALYMQRMEEVPFVAICYYASRLSRGEDFDVGQLLQDRESNTPIQRYLPEWRTSVAALHFGVPETHALQLLLGDRIIEAVNAGDSDQFSELRAVPGFESVLEGVVQDGQTRSNSFVSNLASLLSTAELTEATDNDVWKSLGQAALRFSNWDKFDSLTASGLKAIVDRSSASVRVSIIRSLSALPSEGAVTGASWVENAAAATSGSDSKYIGLQHLRVPASAEFYLSVIDASLAAKLDAEFKAALIPVAKLPDIIEHLSEAAALDGYGSVTLRRIDALKRTKQKWPWSELINSATAAIRNDVENDVTAEALRMLLKLGDDAEAQIVELGRQGYIADAFRNGIQLKNPALAAVALVAVGSYWSDLSLQSHVRRSAEGHNLLANLSTLPDELKAGLAANVVKEWYSKSAGTIRGLLSLAQSYPSSASFIVDTISAALSRSQVPLLNVRSVTDRFDFLYNHSQRASGQNVLIKTTTFKDFWPDESPRLSDDQFGMLMSILPPHLVSQAAANALEKRLAALSSTQWSDALIRESGLVTAFRKVSTLGYRVGIGPNLAPAMKGLANVIADRSPESSENFPWKHLFVAMGADQAKSTAADMADSLLTLNNDGREVCLRFFADDFWHVAAVVAYGDRFTRALVEPLLITGETHAIQLVVSKSTALSKIVGRASRKTRADIFRHLSALQNSDRIDLPSAKTLEKAWSKGRNDGTKIKA